MKSLGNEIILLEHGTTPSVFFRFPGLISSKELIKKVCDFGLITVGADAWLAKEEKPEAGSVILVHANGNEEIGVKKLLDFIDKNKKFTFKNFAYYLAAEFNKGTPKN